MNYVSISTLLGVSATAFVMSFHFGAGGRCVPIQFPD